MLNFCDCGSIKSADQEMCKECREIENRNKRNFTRHLARNSYAITDQEKKRRAGLTEKMREAKRLKNTK